MKLCVVLLLQTADFVRCAFGIGSDSNGKSHAQKNHRENCQRWIYAVREWVCVCALVSTVRKMHFLNAQKCARSQSNTFIECYCSIYIYSSHHKMWVLGNLCVIVESSISTCWMLYTFYAFVRYESISTSSCLCANSDKIYVIAEYIFCSRINQSSWCMYGSRGKRELNAMKMIKYTIQKLMMKQHIKFLDSFMAEISASAKPKFQHNDSLIAIVFNSHNCPHFWLLTHTQIRRQHCQ